MSASPYLLVTGTDTGVGKTVVAAGLARALSRAGLRVVAVKPVETGCGPEVSSEEDGALLAAATGQAEPAAALVRLRTPVTPALAADEEGVTLDFDEIVARIEAHGRGADLVIVEGAGGLLAPITWERSALDLARALGARALVVGADRLGTINHVLLTLTALAGVPLAGVVLSAPATPDASTSTNEGSVLAAARRQGVAGGMRIATLPRVAGVDEAAAELRELAICLAGDGSGR